jgi:hypothetical protein
MQSSFDTQLSPYTTSGTINFEELAIVIVADEFNPSILNPNFLKISGIISTDWELQQQPVLNANVAQLVFKNGVNIVAQGNSLTFTQIIDPNKGNNLEIPVSVRNLVEKLPNADYKTISINPKILVGFPNTQDAGRDFITKKLLSHGAWSNLGVVPPQASVNFFYQLEHCKLILNLNEAQIQQGDQQQQQLIPALLFAGSFYYEVANYAAAERQQKLASCLENWATDLDSFRVIVNQRFLAQDDSVFLVR